MENAIKIQVPVSISYPALEGFLKKQMVGEFIPPGNEDKYSEPPYGQILDISIAGSNSTAWDVMLRIRIKILRTVLKRDAVDLEVYASLDYDNATQLLYVRNFKLNSRTSSRFFNSSLELLANRVAYNQILKKTRVKLGEKISQELKKANGLLEPGLEVKGLKLSGAIEFVQVKDITALQDKISLLLELQANVDVNVFDLISLMPEK